MLPGLVTPRVQGACLSMLWNRWCTPRRFQNRESPDNRCVLGCGGAAEDSIEHYVHCKSIRKVAYSFLRLGRLGNLNKEHFMLAYGGFSNDAETLACMAVLIYAAYNATNCYRQTGGTDSTTAVQHMEQQCRNAAMGHRKLSRILDSRWEEPSGPRARRSQ